MWSEFADKEIIICAVSEYIPVNVFQLKPWCLQQQSRLPTKCTRVCAAYIRRERSFVQMSGLCVCINTITVEGTKDIRDFLSTST